MWWAFVLSYYILFVIFYYYLLEDRYILRDKTKVDLKEKRGEEELAEVEGGETTSGNLFSMKGKIRT